MRDQLVAFERGTSEFPAIPFFVGTGMVMLHYFALLKHSGAD